MPNISPEDIVLVQNIDLDCDFFDELENYSHRDYFQFRWNKQPFRLKPGETRRFPRYLAEHFAKHLANHILIKRQDKTKNLNLLGNDVERKKLLNEIIISVENYYHQDEELNPGQVAAAQVEELNREEERVETLDIGKDESESIEQIKDNTTTISTPESSTTIIPKEKVEFAGVTTETPIKTKPTRSELVEECKNMGIELEGNEKVDYLIEKLKDFC